MGVLRTWIVAWIPFERHQRVFPDRRVSQCSIQTRTLPPYSPPSNCTLLAFDSSLSQYDGSWWGVVSLRH